MEYDYEKPSSLWTEWIVWYDGTSVLAGDIAVMGGTFINHNSLTNDSLDSGYCGNTLEMYGGVFEAEYPLDLTNRDSMILDRYVAGWEGYEQRIIIMDAADLNRDTQVTNRDAIILDRVAAGWEGYYDKYIIMV